MRLRVNRMPRSPAGRRVVWLALAISLVIIAVAQRDLHSRPQEQIRGDKRIWRLLCLNAVPALAYLRWGRRNA